MNKKEQKLPKWFEGELYAEGKSCCLILCMITSFLSVLKYQCPL